MLHAKEKPDPAIDMLTRTIGARPQTRIGHEMVDDAMRRAFTELQAKDAALRLVLIHLDLARRANDPLEWYSAIDHSIEAAKAGLELT